MPAAARRLAIVRAGLELVSGRPPPRAAGGIAEVLALVEAALPSRAPGLRLLVEAPPPRPEVEAPGAIALALLQLAVNAQLHEQVEEVTLRVEPGPTFYIEWPASSPVAAAIDSHRHLARRLRWGWGYVQMVADFLGGVALPPGPTAADREGAALGLGSPRLGLPLARVGEGRVQRATQAWAQERALPGPGGLIREGLADLVAEARLRPGEIAFRDLFRARCRGDATWLVLAPETGSSRARDVLRGLEHERVLWTAPEPHATRIAALAALLAVALGDGWPSVPPSVWDDVFPAACRALGRPVTAAPPSLILPEPRLAAFLLDELGGELVAVADVAAVRLPEAARAPALLAALPPGPDGLVRLG
jgi:hypothetical protein